MRSVVVVAMVFLGGCSHTVQITSDPPGADVYLEGEKIGTTPLTYVEQSSRSGEVDLELRREGQAHRFALERDGVATAPAVGGVGAGLFLFVGGTAALIGGAGLTAAFISLGLLGQGPIPGLGPELTLTIGLVAYIATVVVSTAMLSTAPFAPAIAIGEAGRVLPDQIDVDLFTGEVRTTPGAEVLPLVGVTEGFQPVDEIE